MTAPDELLTSEEVAEFLKIHKNALAEWRCARKANQPPFLRVGSLIRYRRSQVMAWLEAQERTALAAA